MVVTSMTHRAFLPVLFAFMLPLAFLSLASAAGTPQAAKNKDSDESRDLSGVWFTQGNVRANFAFEGASAFLPWGEERLKAGPQKDTLVVLCIPPGVPRVWTEPYPFEIISLPGRILILYEYQHLVRQIYTDGRDHPKDLTPTYMGNSVGRWEASTLVVDTIGFNDKTWIDGTKHPHSDELHLVERIQRVGHDVLKIDITIDDPKTYVKPWTVQRIFDLKRGWEISEQVCEENNSYLFPPDNAKGEK
jgi:hypothetical protein